MGSLDAIDGKDVTSGQAAFVGQKPSRARSWHFDTLQVHAGLEESPLYGQCTLPVYNTASFKFKTSAGADHAFQNMTGSYIYSRCGNVSPTFTRIL
jgi:O-acetylhomoserine/O-acetylserine sulfhydrylase-like pyridoxal-dependent enzyme